MRGSHGVCYCKRKIEVQKLVASAGCPEDAAAVAALPEDWKPKRGGAILTNYLQQREQDHQTVLRDLTDGAKKLNASIDAKVRALAENLLAHIKQNELDIKCVVESCDNEEPLATSDRDEALKNIHKLRSQRIEDIERFKREALALEKERADGLRVLLRDHFQRLIAVGNKPPKELLHEFDERAYEANQQLLSNSRAYSELEAKLRAQADENVKRSKSTLNQLCLGVELSFRRHSAGLASQQNLSRARYSTVSAHSKKSSNTVDLDDLLDDVVELEDCVSRLVESYKSAVKKVVCKFSGKLSDLRKELENRGFSELDFCDYNREELHEMIKSTFRRLSSLKLPVLKNTKFQDVSRLQNSFDHLGTRLQATYLVLHDAGHLWDAHILRSALAQKLTMAAVEDLLTSNDCNELANEVQFNIAFEQLRSCSDVDKLQPQYNLLISLLGMTADLYLQHREAETGRLREYMNLIPIMADTLLAEFNCFLEKYPKEQGDTSYNDLSRVASATLTSPILHTVFQSELQTIALMNWKNGFLESFQCSMCQLPDDLKRQAESWVLEKNSALVLRYAMKIMSHSIRAERVKGALESRMSQLRHHDARLASHVEAMYAFMDALPDEIQHDISFEMPDLYPVIPWIDKIQANMEELLAVVEVDPETKRLKMCSYAARLTKLGLLFDQSLDDVLAEYKKAVDLRIQAARISNIQFLSAIKLFYEGGSYSAQESLKTLAAIVKAGDALEACAAKCSDLVHQRRSQLFSQVEQRLASLRRHTEDYAKPVGKGTLKPSVQKQKKK